ncbi:MAG TPA: Na+/H+ antiporter subunit E [Candidatus Binatia bacterium]|nr:Na+/H+ antiporter subunit E [Candidatus Binatia bacterium]
MFLWNISLAFIWAAVTGRFNLSNVVVGMILGYAVLFVAQPLMGPSSYFRRIHHALAFAAFYIWQLIIANLRVASDVLTPGARARPGVLAIPLEASSDAEITMLANLITLTPGSVSLDVSSDRRFLYLHAMYIDDVEKYRENIKKSFERRVLEVLR